MQQRSDVTCSLTLMGDVTRDAWSATDQEIFEALLHEESKVVHTTVWTAPFQESPLLNANRTGRHDNLVADEITERRRARHRANQRRFSQRKKMMLLGLRQEAAMLEKRLQILQLTMEARQLRTESEELQSQCAPTRSPLCITEQGVRHVLEAACHEALQRYFPVAENDLEPVPIGRDGSLRALGITPTITAQQLTSRRFSVLGWLGKHVTLQANQVPVSELSVSKFFPRREENELQDEIFRILTAPDRLASLSASPVQTKVVELQRLSSDAIVVFRVSCHLRSGAIRRAIELVHRVNTLGAESCYVVIRSLDISSLRSPTDGPHDWHQAITFIEFERRGHSSSRCGGTPGLRIGSTVHYRVMSVVPPNAELEWTPSLVDDLGMLLRLEEAALGPPVRVV